MSSTVMSQSVETIAKTLVEKCRQQQFEAVVREFYAQNIVSIESMEMPDSPKEIHGLDAVLKKSRNWVENTEVHSMDVSDPMVAGSYFAVKFKLDMTCKVTNQRMNMEEIGLYQVENGKIVREQFFYDICQ